MKEEKTTIDELFKKEIKSVVQNRINADLISTVAAHAARDIRVNKELDTLLKTNTGSIIRLKPLAWCYLAIALISIFLIAIPILTIDSETVSLVPQVFLELGLTSSSNQLAQFLLILLLAFTFLLLVFLFIFVPMWNNIKRLDKI